LIEVKGLGPKSFELCAGFLRIPGAENALDASGVHPERYELVERMAQRVGHPVVELMANPELLRGIPLDEFVDGNTSKATLEDILAELVRPGRDPRSVFEAPTFRDDVRQLTDLQLGMELEGIVTNVTAFGAFVDIGVHHDGLVHVSRLSNRFIRDPAEVVNVGDRLTVRVLEVDLERKRISLSARSDGGGGAEPTVAQGPSQENEPAASVDKEPQKAKRRRSRKRRKGPRPEGPGEQTPGEASEAAPEAGEVDPALPEAVAVREEVAAEATSTREAESRQESEPEPAAALADATPAVLPVE
jgi:uncharacterized protein